MKTKIQHNKTGVNGVKPVIREKLVAVNIYIKEEERSQINNLTFHLKTLEKKRAK